MTSLALLLMFMSGLIPTATFAIPSTAGIAITILLIEFDKKTALMSYFAVSFLSLILVADKEAVLVYIFLFGQYPILKTIIERITNFRIAYIIKIVYFNTCVFVIYFLALKIFGMEQLLEEFEEITRVIEILLLGMGNFAFLLYDYTLTIFVPYYFVKIKPKLK